MKSQVTFLELIIADSYDSLSLPSTRDITELRRRYKNHGMWFLEVLLPNLDDMLLSGLSSGRLEPITGFKLKSATSLPEFLFPLWSRVFHLDGNILSAPCIDSIRCIRQITRSFKKVFEVCSDKAIGSSIRTFIKEDRSLVGVVPNPSWDLYTEIAQYVFSKATASAVLHFQDHVKHGPGATAEKLLGPSKWEFNEIPERVLSRVGYDVFSGVYDTGEDVKDSEVFARLIAVPKTKTKPRLISIEPSYNMYIQQGIDSRLREGLSAYPGIDLSSQLPNRNLARLGSIDGSYATIDLSSASDLVSNNLVKHMFSYNKSFVSLIQAVRSRAVETPNGDLIPLNKFASMGSATTFPVEVMVFTTLILAAICKADRNFSRSFIMNVMKRGIFRVYGDDMIIPSQYGRIVVHELESVGLKVNKDKSFFTGPFRESCGGDYMSGIDVTPSYVRRYFPSQRQHVTEIVSLISLRNQLFDKGIYTKSIRHLDSIITGFVPDIRSGDPNVSVDLVLSSDKVDHDRYDRGLQIHLRKGVVISPIRLPADASDKAVLRAALSGIKGGMTNPLFPIAENDKKSLTHVARPTSLRLKRRWVPAV